MGFQFLKLRIKQSQKQIRQLNYVKDKLTESLRTVLKPDDLKQTEGLFRDLYQTEYLRIKAVHTKKLQTLEAINIKAIFY